MHHNLTPAIPGFYSDPTMCAGPDGVYLATSSFELFPGAPVFRSEDLRTFAQVGHVVHRKDQLDLTTFRRASAGIYGSTLRHHDGRFWFATTNIAQAGEGQLLFTAENPAGPWSDPVVVPGTVGIDPDLAWDEDGTCYLTWCAFEGGIAQVTIDPTTGAVLSERRSLWSGTGMKAPEGPHLYRVGDWWYLLIAEGGTERGHSVSVARSRRPDGGFEPHPTNPILTHRSTDHPIQSVGHADLVEWDGQWWACYHGTRPRGYTPEYHVIGRETMLCPVDWVDGWPRFREDLAPTFSPETALATDFLEPLGLRWVSPQGSLDDATVHDGALQLAARPGPTRPVAIRAQDLAWSAEAVLDVRDGAAQLVVYLDDTHFYALETDGHSVRAFGRSIPFEQEFASVAVDDPGSVRLRVTADPAPTAMMYEPCGPDVVRLEVRSGGAWQELASVDGRHLSTEVAGGFTGRLIGVRGISGTTRVTRFEYRPTSPSA